MSGKERAEKLQPDRRAASAKAQQQIAEIEARDGGGTIKKAHVRRRARRARSRSSGSPSCAESEPDIVDLRGLAVPAVGELRALRAATASCTGIMPWNFPFIMAAWKIAPSIAAGNTSRDQAGVVHVAHRARAGARSSQEADLPPGVVNIVAGPGGTRRRGAGAPTRMVDKIAFTGSTEVGRRIMQLASGTVKPVTLELGGKSANIVLDDADLDLAAAGVLWGTFFHNGQVCESGTRALVHRGDLRRVRRPARRARRQDRHRRPAWTWAPTSARSCRRSQVETVERYVALGRDEVRRAAVSAASKPDDLRRRPRPRRVLPARRSSPTSTTRRRSPRRRSSARCCA